MKKIFSNLILVIAFFLVMNAESHAQFTQQGPKLVGAPPVGSFVFQGMSASLSSDGNTAIVGADFDNGGIGAAWVFTRSGTVWSQQQKLFANDAVGVAHQGISVCISSDGNTAIVGGGNDNNSTGAAWIYTRSGGVWTQRQKLLASDALNGAAQGWSVSISGDGNTVIVGGFDLNAESAAWIYTRSGNIWTQQGLKLIGTNTISVGTGEVSVSISNNGNTAIIGGAQDNGGAGAAWIFIRNSGIWTQPGPKLVGTGGDASSIQGNSVSLSYDGGTAIVGGAQDNGGAGAAWIYTISGGVGTQQGSKLVGFDSDASSDQGRSVSLSSDGNIAITGGDGDNGGIGAAWVYTRSGGVWTQQGNKLVGTGAIGGSLQGFSAAISSDGTTVISGGPFDNNGIGATWVYSNCPGVPPQPGVISGTVNPCYNTSQIYSVAPVVGATSYIWTTPIGWIGTSTTNSITVTVMNSSINLTVRAVNACGNGPIQTIALTVAHTLPQPAVITGMTSVCKGSIQTYSVPLDINASSYTWTLPSGWVGTSSTNSITVTAGTVLSGNVSVNANNVCGAGPIRALWVSLISVTPVTISGVPGNYNFCSQIAPLSVTLTASSGYSSYSWSPGGQIVNSINVNVANTYIVTATDAISGCTTTASKTVTNNCALPTALSTTNILGTSAVATWIQSQCRVNYTIRISVHGLNIWTSYTINPNNNYSFIGLSLSTQYDWQIQTNCNTSGSVNSGWSPIQTFTTLAHRMAEERNTGISFSIYPNPADAFVKITFSSMDEGSFNIQLTDMMGRVVKSETDNAISGDNIHIMNMEGIAKGIYMVTLQKGDNISKSKLVVE